MGVQSMGSSSSWVVDIEKMLEHTDPAVEMARWKKPSIYRVPERIKRTSNSQFYRPQFVSLGPFHNNEPDLLPMEEHKLRALLHLVNRARRPVREFVAALEEVAHELLDTYDNLDGKWLGSNMDKFLEVMLKDGCFLLEMVRTQKHVMKGKALKDYAPNDPIFSIRGFYFLRGEIRGDMILMENQLPLLVLQRILLVQKGISSPSAKDINHMVLRFLGGSLHEDNNKLGLHPLDLYHKSFRGPKQALREGTRLWEDTMPSAVELSEARVHFKNCNTGNICDIDFKGGVLTMPLVTVYDDTEGILLNLMAFERLDGYAGNDVTDYVIFMDNIINSERDVALLRSKGLVKCGLGSDKEVAGLFNRLAKGAVMSPFCKLFDVQQKVNAHCRKPCNKWLASFEHTYLRNPWVFVSLIAATILLVAAVMQTIYTVVTFYGGRS